MKKLVLVLGLVAMLLNSCTTVSDESKNLVNRQAPNVNLSILDGNFESLYRYRGKTVVLFFWATWCRRSKALITELNEYARLHKGENVEFIAVSVDRYENAQVLRNMVYLQGLDSLTHAFSGSGIKDEAYYYFNFNSVPSIAVIGPDGYVKGVGDSMSVVERYVSR